LRWPSLTDSVSRSTLGLQVIHSSLQGDQFGERTADLGCGLLLFRTDHGKTVCVLKSASEDVFVIWVIEAPNQIRDLPFDWVDMPDIILSDSDAAVHVSLPRSTDGSSSVVYDIMVNEGLLPWEWCGLFEEI
jgi:hypothetical protein